MPATTFSPVRDQLEAALHRINDTGGEGARTCLTVYSAAARGAADAADARAKAGVSLGPMDGATVTIKDLFDVAGETTRAGSSLRVEAAPALRDAVIVTRLRQAGAVIVAKTNMSEFAFHGMGTNPHFGTPGNPADRARVPGGSSSGAAVAVADGMGSIAIGSDTGGSTRLPAAFCGVVGYKPTAKRVPTHGAFPLSYTLDSIGPLARTVAECALADAVMAGEHPIAPVALGVPGLRLGVVRGMPFEQVDGIVGPGVEAALMRLGKAGAHLADVDFKDIFDGIAALNARMGFASTEAFAIHRDWIDDPKANVDVNVRMRIERGRHVSAADYLDMLTMRRDLIAMADVRMAPFDAIVLPTTPMVAPRIAEIATPEAFSPINMLALRNTTQFNILDCCGISLPVPGTSLPVGLMLIGRHGTDRHLFAVASGVEQVLAL